MGAIHSVFMGQIHLVLHTGPRLRTLATQLTAGGQYKVGNSTQLRNVPTVAQSGWLEYCGQ